MEAETISKEETPVEPENLTAAEVLPATVETIQELVKESEVTVEESSVQ